MARSSDLSSAHRGYAYQDLATAIALAQALVADGESVTVDRKLVTDDRFDDLSVRDSRGWLRRQLKWSEPGARALKQGDFTRKQSALRIDQLVLSYARMAPDVADEYRLLVAWAAPASDDELWAVLEPTPDVPTVFPEITTRRFRIVGERVWPEDKPPVWSALEGRADLDRTTFLEFSRRFVIETDAPGFSQDLTAPGPLERVLLNFLVERVGVGEYPNQHRTPEDVAARLIVLAAAARTSHRTVTRAEVAHEIALRVDDGRVSQQFPVDPARRVPRDVFRAALREAMVAGQIVTVVAPPGAGKSWALTELAEELREAGHLVARHYCYLEPGDPDIARRVTTDALFGNLVGELLELNPSLRDAKVQAYASTSAELERVLAAAAVHVTPEPVVLIVDGVDHISRVLAESSDVRRADTEIVEELAALALPKGVCLVVGSQPGPHLAPLADIARELRLPAWERSDVTALARRLGLADEQVAAGGDPALGWHALWKRSEGNPLYATFLVREFRETLARGHALLLTDWLQEAPDIGGDIAYYYAHLYERLDGVAQQVADLLGLVDFAVTEQELAAIVPDLLRTRLPDALHRLRPILVDVAGRGGLRVFHESFRRFTVERLRAAGLGLDAVLVPVVGWLEGLGFFADAKAFRYLLPALRRAGRTEDVLRLVGPTFVSDAVAAGHPRGAVERNLDLAIEVAARAQRWPDLVRLAELYRSAHTCFEESLYDPVPYWETFLDVAGADAMSERLLFEGRPTIGRHLGLILCSRIDDAGGAPPWAEYLDLPPAPLERAESRRPDASWVGAVLAAIAHGTMRMSGDDAARVWVTGVLTENDDFGDEILSALADRFVRTASDAVLDALVGAEDVARSFRVTLLGLRARLRSEGGDLVGARDIAAQAYTIDAERGAAVAAAFGVEHCAAAALPDPRAFDIGLEPARRYPERENVAAWVEAVQQLALFDQAGVDALDARIGGPGWYRCWLRYVVLVSRAESLARRDRAVASALAVQAFNELTRDTRPFVGEPRACDLTPHRATILNSLGRGLALLATPDAWRTAVAAIERVVDGTSTNIRGTPTGPILRESLGELLLPFAREPAIADLLRESVRAQIAAAEAGTEYFSNLTDVEMVAARAFSALGEKAEARAHWRRAAVYLTAYGFRKDGTFYEVLEGLPAFADMPARQLEALERLQPLAEAVLRHTDGRGTHHVLNSWFRALAATDAVAALSLVARTLVADGGSVDARVETAALDAIRAVAADADPLIVAAAQMAFRFDADDGERASEEASRRLGVLERLADTDREAARHATRRALAQIEGDAEYSFPDALDSVVSFAKRHELRVGSSHGPLAFDRTGERDSPDVIRGEGSPMPAVLRAPMQGAPSGELTPLLLMAELRSNLGQNLATRRSGGDERLSNRIGYACLGWLEAGREDDVTRLIRFLARELAGGYHETELLAALAEGFARYA
ncbi:MAG TPA: AAA family ATPase [Gemmatimonadaceae bacterium]|nr:AAA family ATPase [Gemmatimonadaceae bacterium]